MKETAEKVFIVPTGGPRVKSDEVYPGAPFIHLLEGVPVFYVKINNVTFSFLMDTSVRHNIIDPALMEWIDIPKPTGNSFWEPRPVEVIHEIIPKKKIVCKDGVERNCEMIKLNFATYEADGSTTDHSEEFAIDPSMSRFFVLPKNEKLIAGVLGVDFLMKNRWL